MVNLQRWRIRAAAGLAVLAGAMLVASMSAAARGASESQAPEARAARTLKATDTAHLHKVSVSGSLLIEEGKATGTLPGKMRASVNVGATISGTFTFYLHGGTIKGHGGATPHGEGTYESFAGTVTVKGGTGRYAHAHGQTKLYGTIDRQTEEYPLVIQTTGTLSY
jgi:hypothetical protein